MIQLAWGSHSDRGLRRTQNEDSFLAAPPLFFVADGMGGHAAGDRASAAAIAAFACLCGPATVALEDVEDAFERAAHAVSAVDPGGDAGTTISGVALTQQHGEPYWLVVNIGDSRTYRLNAGGLEQISVDHSAVQELIERGDLTVAEAELHPKRNVITKAVGAGSHDDPDYWLIPVEEGDRMMVCSDGLSKELAAEHLARILSEEPSAQAAATRLVHEALVHGGRDNITVVVVDASGAHRAPEGVETATRPADEDTLPRSWNPQKGA